MLKLTLIRHAKSSWQNTEIDDFERPLNSRGRRDAPVMAQRMQRAFERPDLLVSSPALRAISTARIFAETLGLPTVAIQLQAKIYEASATALLDVLRELDDAHAHVALFGHNPGVSALAQLLGHRRNEELPTCGIAHFSLAIAAWKELTPDSGVLLKMLWPKDGAALPD